MDSPLAGARRPGMTAEMCGSDHVLLMAVSWLPRPSRNDIGSSRTARFGRNDN